MINLVIADDEERVCRLIAALGDWERLGIRVAGTAANGIEALNLIRRETVHILITDIRMPGMNGLELLENVRNASPDTRMIIISGYAAFEYAQKARGLGAREYLLKPISREALNAALERMAEEIRADRQRNAHIENMEQQRSQDIHLLREQAVTDLLKDPQIVLTEEQLENTYHFHSEQGKYRIFILRTDDEPDGVRRETILAGWRRRKEILENTIRPLCIDMVMTETNEELTGICHYPADREENFRRTLRECLNQMIGWKEIYGSGTLTMALGSAVNSPGELTASLKSAVQRIQERILTGTGKIIESNTSRQVLYEMRLPDQFSRVVSHALEHMDSEELLKSIRQIYKKVNETEGVHGWEIADLVSQMASLFTLRLEIPDKKIRLDEFGKTCRQATSVEELFNGLEAYADEQMQKLKEDRRDDQARPIRQAKAYIRNHYNEPLSLESVSEMVGLTPAYFSTLFKKDTEEGFTHYLQGVRMEAAKDLLRETNISIAQICQDVGYADQKHFTRLFEKTVGVKPNVYRKMYG